MAGNVSPAEGSGSDSSTGAAGRQRWARARQVLAEAERQARAPGSVVAETAVGRRAAARTDGQPVGGARDHSHDQSHAGGQGESHVQRQVQSQSQTRAQAQGDDPHAVARAIVLRQLSMAPRSRAQLESKLRQRGCDDDVAAEVLDRFTEVGLIDDEAFAEMLVRSKQSGSGLAGAALAQQLRRAGIDREIADPVLSEVTQGQERVRAEELVAKRLRTMHGLAPDVQARRLAAMLARKGYAADIVWPVVRDALDGAVEHARD